MRGPRMAIWAAGWAVVLLGGAVWASRSGTATARDQLTIADGRPVVDRAAGLVVASLGTDVVVSVSDFEKVDDCDVTPVRPGARYQRVVRIYTARGAERDALTHLAATLPAQYRARVAGRDHPSFSADAGDFVGLTGSSPAAGQIRVAVETGCRPTDDGAGESPPVPADDTDDAVAKATRPLTALSLRATRAAQHGLACPDGRAVRTVELTAGRSRFGQATVEDVVARLGTVVLTDLDLFAYRDGAADVVLRMDGDTTVATATMRC